LIFLYRNVLHKELDLPTRLITAKRSTHLPTVLTPTEVHNVLQYVEDTAGLITRLLYGSGMRLQECLRLRVKDIDFGNHRIIVRSAKGANDRSTLLPETLIEPLHFQLKTIQLIHQEDLKEGNGETLLPFALSKKYPNATTGTNNASYRSAQPVNRCVPHQAKYTPDSDRSTGLS
jgi:integrase